MISDNHPLSILACATSILNPRLDIFNSPFTASLSLSRRKLYFTRPKSIRDSISIRLPLQIRPTMSMSGSSGTNSCWSFASYRVSGRWNADGYHSSLWIRSRPNESDFEILHGASGSSLPFQSELLMVNGNQLRESKKRHGSLSVRAYGLSDRSDPRWLCNTHPKKPHSQSSIPRLLLQLSFNTARALSHLGKQLTVKLKPLNWTAHLIQVLL